jgi:hypothetical protein
MSVLYNLYRHPEKGTWGFSTTQHGKVRTAFVDSRSNVLKRSEIEPLKLAPTLAGLLRGGYSKVASPQYLQVGSANGIVTGAFVGRHPDLGELLAGELVLFAAIPQGTATPAIVETWAAILAASDSAKPDAREQWLQHCREVGSYFPAMSSEPHAALLVGQWAREARQAIVPSRGGVPIPAPKDARHEWRDFLTMWFELARIDEAFNDLGWPLAEALNLIPAIAAESPQGGDDGWIDIASQAAF